jgi:hypothetical protein
MARIILATLLLALLFSAMTSGGMLSVGLTKVGARTQKHSPADSNGWRATPTLGGVQLGQDFSGVMSSLGKGDLVYTSPDYVEEKERRYQWKTSTGVLEVGFGDSDRVTFIGLSAKSRVQTIAGVYLNTDTICSIRAKLGRPDRTEGPDLDETVASFSLVYLAGPRRSQEVHFVSNMDWDRAGLDPASISSNLFSKRAVVKVFIKGSHAQ